MTVKSVLATGATAALLTASACGSQKTQHATPQAPPQTTTATRSEEPTIKGQADRYLAIVEPVSKAYSRFGTEYDKLNPDTVSRSEFNAVVKPLAAAADKANTALLRADWSPGVRPDIRSLVDADATTVADISTAYDNPDAEAAIARDLAQVRVAANAVRADLGLPPSK